MNQHDEILTYGLQRVGTKNVLIHIDNAKNGRDCNCKCPHCHAPLVARNGGKGGRYRQNIHHFAHDRGYEPCGKGRMSALHIMVQQVLEKEKQVMLPEYSQEYVRHASELKPFDSVTLEEVCKAEDSTRRPDCIGRPFNNNDSLWIEIFCCNPIKMDRKQDIIRRKQHCIEIDFSDLLGTDYTKESVRERLLNKSEDRKWICHPEWDEEERQKEEEVRRLQEEARKRKEEEERQRIEEERRKMKEFLLKQEKENRQTADLQSQRRARSLDSLSFLHKSDTETKPQINNKRDWVMYAKQSYGNDGGRKSFYATLTKEYLRVTFENSEHLVAKEAHSKINDLLPRTDNIERPNKIYLELLLAIWVLDRLNHYNATELGRIFVENQNFRNTIFKSIKQIGNINKRNIEDTLVSDGIENRNEILQILHTCYTK